MHQYAAQCTQNGTLSYYIAGRLINRKYQKIEYMSEKPAIDRVQRTIER
jgi:hypothetical protein